MNTTAELDLNDGTLTPTGSASSIISLVDIKKTAGYDTTFQAIIVPHLGSAMSSSVQLLTVRKLFTWPIPSSFDFDAGKVYTFNLTLNGDAIIEFTADISPWDAGGNDSGSLVHDNSGTEYRQRMPNGDLMDVVYINKGEFTMGDLTIANATPHPVSLTRSFLMSQYEITAAQYAKFLNSADGIVIEQTGATNYQANMDVSGLGADMPAGMTKLAVSTSTLMPYDGSQWTPLPGKDNFPIDGVTYEGALAYAKWAGGDLPTEAQWEYAARAGSNAPFINGLTTDTNLADHAWFGHTTAEGTKEVGGAAGYKNAWNLYDMSGNVEEWCKDLTASPIPDYANGSAAVVDPLSQTGSIRTVRGGGYADANTEALKLGHRGSSTVLRSYIGIRIIYPLQ